MAQELSDTNQNEEAGKETTSSNMRCGCDGRVGGSVMRVVERGCSWWGGVVAGCPLRASLTALLLVGVCCLGFVHLRQELRPYHLWVPQHSPSTKVNEWRIKHFPVRHRLHSVLWLAEDNILTAEAVQQMWYFHQRINNFVLRVGNVSVTWQDVCVQVPALPHLSTQRTNSSNSGLMRGHWEGIAHKMSRGQYCGLLHRQPHLCNERSLLEVWGYDHHRIMALTDRTVLRDLNRVAFSAVFGHRISIDGLLGGVRRDEQGQLVGATSAIHTWLTYVKPGHTKVVDIGTGDEVDQEGLAWENMLLQEAQAVPKTSKVALLVRVAHSFGDESIQAMMGDVRWVVVGWATLVAYTLITLGAFVPVLVGLLCVALATAAAMGACLMLGVSFSPVNLMLPVLLLGLGVDDMYVIMASWKAVGEANPIQQCRQVLGRAGVAITLTSVTDVLAFLVGATTQVPALRWFCIYAAVGVIAIFLLQTTLFLASLVVSQPCMGNHCSSTTAFDKLMEKKLLQRAIKRYGAILVKPLVAIGVVMGAGLLLGAGIWRAAQLHQQSNPMWFLPHSSYLYRWFSAMEQQFPKRGETGSIYFASVSLPEELANLHQLTAALQHSPYVDSTDAWFTGLDHFMREDKRYSGRPLTRELLHDALALFLHSPKGARFTSSLKFHGPLSCSEPTPQISAFKIGFRYKVLQSAEEQVAAMKEVQWVVATANLTGFHAAWAHAFTQWEVDTILSRELWRNIGVVVGVVGIVTVVVVGTWVVALLVVACVLAMVVQVAALMQVWGLTLETVTIVALTLSAGLCVDYVAHVAHAFLVVAGDRKERVMVALGAVGPPVLHAGTSTFLAFLALAPSNSYTFSIFFKVFTGASVLGMVYGLVVLPALLSLLGPHSHPHTDHTPSKPSQNTLNTPSQPSQDTLNTHHTFTILPEHTPYAHNPLRAH